MSRTTTRLLLTGITLLLARPAFAQNKSGEPKMFVVNDSLAHEGETVWSAKGCLSCHTFGKSNIIAPDLGGLLARRTPAWVKSFLHDPDALLATDDTAKALLLRYNNLRMPNFKLTDEEIEAVMHYIAAQSRPKEK